MDIAVYHCQQAAEKALKAWLTRNDTVFAKTHDLQILINQCQTTQAAFSNYQTHVRILSPFATEFRYPGDFEEPDPKRASEALTFAEELVEFCGEIIEKMKRV